MVVSGWHPRARTLPALRSDLSAQAGASPALLGPSSWGLPPGTVAASYFTGLPRGHLVSLFCMTTLAAPVCMAWWRGADPGLSGTGGW